MINRLKNNTKIKIISFLSAIALWMYVMAVVDPEETKGFEDIPVSISNMSDLKDKNLVIYPDEKLTADVYIKEPHGGRGGWSWYTGASGWMYKVGLEDILGLKKIEGKGYKIEPCIPEMWNEYDINIKNETEDYKIKVKRGEDKGITINGEKANNDSKSS